RRRTGPARKSGRSGCGGRGGSALAGGLASARTTPETAMKLSLGGGLVLFIRGSPGRASSPALSRRRLPLIARIRAAFLRIPPRRFSPTQRETPPPGACGRLNSPLVTIVSAAAGCRALHPGKTPRIFAQGGSRRRERGREVPEATPHRPGRRACANGHFAGRPSNVEWPRAAVDPASGRLRRPTTRIFEAAPMALELHRDRSGPLSSLVFKTDGPVAEIFHSGTN
ncbi:hypothetical protein HPB47_007668, partial [Ixodes persulcatus]